MSGSGTDKTKSGVTLAGPVVILVEPQLGENIGMAARAMGNFGLTRLRIVNPRDGWPNISAQRAASGADHILDHVELFDTIEQAGPLSRPRGPQSTRIDLAQAAGAKDAKALGRQLSLLYDGAAVAGRMDRDRRGAANAVGAAALALVDAAIPPRRA